MDPAFSAFRWTVQPGAYRWRTPQVVGPEQRSEERALWAGETHTGQTQPLRQYHPLVDQTGLFLLFAATPLTQEGILGFVDRFGMLLNATVTVTPPAQVRTPRQRRLRETLAVHSEGLEFWLQEVIKMREAVRVWRLLEQGDADGLARHIRRSGRGKQLSLVYDSHPDLAEGAQPEPPDLRLTEVIVSPGEQPELLARLAAGDVVLPARMLLQRFINRQFDGRLQPAVAPDADSGELQMTLMPANLLTAMWLQLARAVCEHKQYKECSVCGEPFELSPETARTNRRFCSIACKNRAFRNRQEQARRLHAEGKTAEQIAEQIEADTAVVEGWIRGPGQR